MSYDRPRHGGSSARPGRDVASAAEDAEVVADALDVETFALVGHSGGGPHALACAASLPGRVRAVAAISCPARFGAAGLDWFAGMGPNSAATLRAAATGSAARERVEPDFTPADWAALAGTWSWFGEVVGPALAGDRHAPVDDDLAYAGPWGSDPATITAKTPLMHGRDDTAVPAAHSEWPARHIPGTSRGSCRGWAHLGAGPRPTGTGVAAAQLWVISTLFG